MTDSIMVDIKAYAVDSVNQRNVLYARHGVNVNSTLLLTEIVPALGSYTFTGVTGNSLTIVRSTVDFTLTLTNSVGSLALGTGRLFILPNFVSMVVTNPSTTLPAAITFLHG